MIGRGERHGRHDRRRGSQDDQGIPQNGEHDPRRAREVAGQPRKQGRGVEGRRRERRRRERWPSVRQEDRQADQGRQDEGPGQHPGHGRARIRGEKGRPAGRNPAGPHLGEGNPGTVREFPGLAPGESGHPALIDPVGHAIECRDARRQKIPNTKAGKNAAAASENAAETNCRMSASRSEET